MQTLRRRISELVPGPNAEAVWKRAERFRKHLEASLASGFIERSRSVSPARVVLICDSLSQRAAQLYAKLFVCVTINTSIVASVRLEFDASVTVVIFASRQSLKAVELDLLFHAFNAKRIRGWSIFPIHEGEQGYWSVVKAWIWANSSPTSTLIADSDATESVDRVPPDTTWLYGNRLSGTLQTLLRGVHRLVVFVGHGDELDVRLGNFYICSRIHAPVTDQIGLLRCANESTCYRIQGTQGRDPSVDSLILPPSIFAEIAFLNSCSSGWIGVDGRYGAHEGLGLSMFNSNCATVIASHGPRRVTRTDSLATVRFLAKHKNAAVVAKLLNRLAVADRREPTLITIGNPFVSSNPRDEEVGTEKKPLIIHQGLMPTARASKVIRGPVLKRRSGQMSSHENVRGGLREDLEWLTLAGVFDEHSRLPELVQRPHGLKDLSHRGAASRSCAETIHYLQVKTMSLLLERSSRAITGPIADLQVSQVVFRHVPSDRCCKICFSRLYSCEYAPSALRTKSRRIQHFCPRCTIVSDAPQNSTLFVAINASTDNAGIALQVSCTSKSHDGIVASYLVGCCVLGARGNATTDMAWTTPNSKSDLRIRFGPQFTAGMYTIKLNVMDNLSLYQEFLMIPCLNR